MSEKDTRKKDANWNLNVNEDGSVPPNQAQLAILMDIRDELKRLNERLYCSRVSDIPYLLKQIQTNTKKKRKKK